MQRPNLKSLLKKTMISHLQDKLASVESAVKRWRHENEIDEESSTSKFSGGHVTDRYYYTSIIVVPGSDFFLRMHGKKCKL